MNEFKGMMDGIGHEVKGIGHEVKGIGHDVKGIGHDGGRMSTKTVGAADIS